MKNLTPHQIKTSLHPTIVHNNNSYGPSNSSAARWSESSATNDCFATQIRDRAVLVQYEECNEADFNMNLGDNTTL